MASSSEKQSDSWFLLAVKVFIGILLVVPMGAWEGLKFFRRLVYSKGTWLRELTGAASGLASGIEFGYLKSTSDPAHGVQWQLMGLLVAFAVYAYAFPGVFWVGHKLIEPLFPFFRRVLNWVWDTVICGLGRLLKSALKHLLKFIELVFTNLVKAVRSLVRHLIIEPIRWVYDNVVVPVLIRLGGDLLPAGPLDSRRLVGSVPAGERHLPSCEANPQLAVARRYRRAGAICLE